MTRDGLIVVAGGELVAPAQTTTGVDRHEAFADDHVWVGRVRTEPNQWSGWHSHPGHDTYVYAMNGRFRVEYGEGGAETAEILAGDFVRISKGLVHREGNPGDVPNEGIIFRVGEGPILVNLDVPEGS